MKKSSGHGLITWPGLLLLALSVALYLTRSRTKNRPTVTNSINKDAAKVFTTLVALGFTTQQASFITAQAGHETGDFKSVIFKENNNCFGMKFPSIRKTFATGTNHGHATFTSLTDCIQDFLLYYKFVKLLDTYSSIDAYVKALKDRKYFEADLNQYIAGCVYYHKKYFETK
jgi:hypothetical protein